MHMYVGYRHKNNGVYGVNNNDIMLLQWCLKTRNFNLLRDFRATAYAITCKTNGTGSSVLRQIVDSFHAK